MMRTLPFAAALLGTALLGVAPALAGTAPATAPQVVTFRVLPDGMGLLGPDGHHHDSFVPASVVIHKGQKVTFRFINYDDSEHTMTSMKLGINFVVQPGKHAKAEAKKPGVAEKEVQEPPVTPTVTSYTFTPKAVGQFRWHCLIPCDGGANKHWAMGQGMNGMGHTGFMAGYIVVM